MPYNVQDSPTTRNYPVQWWPIVNSAEVSEICSTTVILHVTITRGELQDTDTSAPGLSLIQLESLVQGPWH